VKTGHALWSERMVRESGQLAFYALQHAALYGSLPNVILITACTANGKVKGHRIPCEDLDRGILDAELNTTKTIWDAMSDFHELRKQR